MTASDDRPARGFIQLFRPGLLVLLEALKVSFCHSSHRLPPFSVTFFFQFNRLVVRMLPFCQHLPVLSLFISAIFCFLRSSPRKYRKYALLCCSCLFLPFCHAFSSCDFPFSFSGFFFFLCNLFKPGLAGILILCVFFGRSGTKGFCFPASAFTPHRAADRCPETFMWPFVSAVQGRGVGASDCPSERQRNANYLDNSLLSCYVSVSVSVGWAVLSGGFPLVSPLSSCSFSAG